MTGWRTNITRRRAAKWVAALIVAGFVINLVVTWVLAVTRAQVVPGAVMSGAGIDWGDVRWSVRRYDCPGMTRLYWTGWRWPPPQRPSSNTSNSMGERTYPILFPGGLGVPAWSRIAGRKPQESDMRQDELLVEVGFGWPCIAASYEYRRYGTMWISPHAPVAGGIELRDRLIWGGAVGASPITRVEVVALPYRPAWSGLLGNWALWSAFLAALSGTGRCIRRFLDRRPRRLQAGLCPTCAYDLRHDFVHGCPECGWQRS
jgi:hypothetical protein